MKIINNNKFYWFAICGFEIFGRIGRSFICMWEARDSRKMGFGCFSYGDITFLAFRAKAAVLFALLPQLIIPSRWIQSTSAPTPLPHRRFSIPCHSWGGFFLASQKENNPPTFVKELCHVVIISKKLASILFLFFSPFLVLSVCVTSLVVFHFTKQLVWWINIFLNLKISLYVANLWLRISWQSSLSRWSRHWNGFFLFFFPIELARILAITDHSSVALFILLSHLGSFMMLPHLNPLFDYFLVHSHFFFSSLSASVCLSDGFVDNHPKLSTSTCMVAWGLGLERNAFWATECDVPRSVERENDF